MVLVLQFSTLSANVSDFIYYNSGTTTSRQRYELVPITAIYNEGYQYKDDVFGSNAWHTGQLAYLFERYENGTIGTPSSGLRSSVPLGPVGQGTFELRGDGRMTDFSIFNNGPNAEPNSIAVKIDLNDAVFGFKFVDESTNKVIVKIIQTSPYDELMVKYAIESLTYFGSYPSSRLQIIDSDLQSIGINYINLTAFSSFEPLNANKTSKPSVVFYFSIDTNNDNLLMDFFFNWPDIVNIDDIKQTNANNGFTLNKNYNASDPRYFTSGNITFNLYSCIDNQNECNIPINQTSYIVGNTLYDNWLKFIGENETIETIETNNIGPNEPTIYNHYGIINKNIEVSSNMEFSFMFSWFFPQRTFNNNKQYLGNYYNNFYSSSEKVNDDIVENLSNIISSIEKWHKFWDSSNNDLYPDYLKDTFINGASFIARTGYFLESDINNTGIWRQSESFSCFQIDPPHIHGYRSFAYQLIYGDILDRGTLSMYSYGQINDDGEGLVSELFGGGCSNVNGIMGEPSGGKRGDDNSIYIMDMYAQFKWYRDGKDYVGNKYQYVKQAMNWIINASVPFGLGLPYRLVNTNDEHGVIGDVNTYNSMLYISALNAMKIMTQYFEPNKQGQDYIDNTLQPALNYASGNLSSLLWNQGYYREEYCKNGQFSPDSLQSDVLYGYLWGLILDLIDNDQLPMTNILSHLDQVYNRNWSPFGLVFMTNRTVSSLSCSGNDDNDDILQGGFQDFDTWEMATIDHFVERIYLNYYLNDSLSSTMNILKTELDKYRMLFRDQWDYRDTSSTYEDLDPEYSRPVVNSHYCRQLIHYTSIFALNGQKLNVDQNNKLTLSINPKISLNGNNKCLPILIPQSHFLLCLDSINKCFELNGTFGTVYIDELNITNSDKTYQFENTTIKMDQMTKLCY